MSSPSQNPFIDRQISNSKILFESGSFRLDSNIINLTAGAPGPDRLEKCCDIFEVATMYRMKQEKADNALLFQYGPAVGRTDYHKAVAKFLTDKYHDEVNCNDLVLTTGATQGLQQVLNVLIDLNGVIFVDALTFPIALQTFAQFSGLRVVTVPMTEDGVDVNALRRLVAAHKCECEPGKLFWGMYYTIPVFHNPTGMSFTSDVCIEIVKIAREYDVLVLTEDVYNTLAFDQAKGPPMRLFAYDRRTDEAYKGNVISNGTFSKILAPGVRVGWLETPPRALRILHQSGVLAGGAANNYTSGVIVSALELNLVNRVFEDNIQVYAERMKMAISLLREKLPATCRFQTPIGGYFIWIKMPEHIDAGLLNIFLRANYEVIGVPGNVFSGDGSTVYRNCVRLAISYYQKDRLEDGIQRFCAGVCEYFAKNPKA